MAQSRIVNVALANICACEDALRKAGVPKDFWCYISANSTPSADDPEDYDGDLGCIFYDRAHMIDAVAGKYPVSDPLMASVAVDGRNTALIYRYIGVALSTEDMTCHAKDMRAIECRLGMHNTHPMKTRSRGTA